MTNRRNFLSFPLAYRKQVIETVGVAVVYRAGDVMRKPRRNIFLLFAGIAVCASFPVFESLAQSYPVKPIRILLGFPAGSATDLTARTVAQKLSGHLGQPVIVENRTGAGGSIATETVAKSPADGYTLLLMAAADTVQPALRAKLPYDLQRDLAPVSLVTIGALVFVVHPSVPARNVKELIALARSQPGKLSYGSGGAGSSSHLAGELLGLMAKVRFVHVPYRGSPQAAIAAAAGETDMGFPSISGTLPLLGAGKLRALAVTSAKRTSVMPSIPTLNESGLPGYDRSSWYGLLAPAGVPNNIIDRLNAVIGKAVNTPEMVDSFKKQGLEVQTNTPEQFAAFIHGQLMQNAKLVKLAGLKAQ